ncbi:MAG: myo-inosose-2 dehydratase [Butyricicoccus sp.]|nr:myo-inosose-2 dehydratase [Butyricicoccus pullicaecorum]
MLDPNKVKLGMCPIGWSNDDMWDLGDENTFQQCVSEMALAGFTGSEVGHKYPTDVKVLKHMLDVRGMTIASKWFSSFLVDKPYEEVEAEFVKELEYLSAVGATAINISEQSGSIQGMLDKRVLKDKRILNDEEWARLCEGLNKLGKLSLEKYGIRSCFHHHMGTVVQTVEETTRLMENTDPKYVFLCFDTGHFTFAGEDPVAMLEKFADRVGHVHLKNMRMPIVEKVKAEDWSFLKAVREGAFTVPGDPDGCVQFDDVFALLDKAGYEGWIMVEAEQDPAKANPFEYAKMARAYIKEHTGL